ncbi:hypothetical protein ABFG93_03310 [Pseudalkalibacillus hwajinpoensis]|uniref:hypothetical protein n=1 Tax=Guptibacillus hwajinpoensis TaxID=208199 RepID=UPI00325C1559
MQGEKLSYSRLITRTKYFQEKSLELEKELIFAKDQITSLEKELSSKKASDEQITQLKGELENLQHEIENKTKENVAKILEIEKRNVAQSTVKVYEKKVKGYEALLADMQIDINEKDKLLNHLQGKIKNLEKRTKYMTSSAVEPEESTGTKLDEVYAIAYFNTSIIMSGDQSVIIRGDLQIENRGARNLQNPIVCFRFNPIETAVLKGRIFPIEEAETRANSSSDQTHWVFTEHDWLEKSREKGEIWVAPLHPVTLKPGDQIGIDSFQIPVRSEFKEPVSVEGFVFFQKENYRIRVSNQIAISY